MERHRTMRAYSAGGVVFRLVPQRSTEDSHTTDKQSDGRDIRDVSIEVVLVGRSHAGIWALPKGTPKPGGRNAAALVTVPAQGRTKIAVCRTSRVIHSSGASSFPMAGRNRFRADKDYGSSCYGHCSFRCR